MGNTNISTVLASPQGNYTVFVSTNEAVADYMAAVYNVTGTKPLFLPLLLITGIDSMWCSLVVFQDAVEARNPITTDTSMQAVEIQQFLKSVSSAQLISYMAYQMLYGLFPLSSELLLLNPKQTVLGSLTQTDLPLYFSQDSNGTVVVQGIEGSVGDLLSESVACNGILWVTNGVLLPGSNFTSSPLLPSSSLSVEEISSVAEVHLCCVCQVLGLVLAVCTLAAPHTTATIINPGRVQSHAHSHVANMPQEPEHVAADFQPPPVLCVVTAHCSHGHWI